MTTGTLTPSLLLGGLFVLLLVCERWVPLREASSATTLQHASNRGRGLLQSVELPAALHFAAGSVLTFCYWHLANHRIGFLWRFEVHHIDRDLDATTAFRRTTSVGQSLVL